MFHPADTFSGGHSLVFMHFHDGLLVNRISFHRAGKVCILSARTDPSIPFLRCYCAAVPDVLGISTGAVTGSGGAMALRY